VPFVRTISRLTQVSDGTYEEYVLTNEMPGLLGAGAEFVANENAPHFQDEVIDLAAITSDSILIGHLIGGIKSASLNPFTQNNTNVTDANAVIYEVWLQRSSNNSVPVVLPVVGIEINVFPNPAVKELAIDFNLSAKHNIELFVLDGSGKLVHDVYYEKVKNASKKLDLKELQLKAGAYTLQFIIDDQQTLTKQITIQ
jgi:hypothetical protein